MFVEPYSSEISSFVIVSQHMADLKSPPQDIRIKPKLENSSNDVVKSVGQQHPSDESILTSFDSSKIAIVEFVNEVLR